MDKFVDCVSEQHFFNSTETLQLQVAQVRLHWTIENNQGDAPGNEGSQAWPCQYNQGVTGFDLAEGTANLWVTPECAGGRPASPDTYIAPAIVQRTVIRGDTVSLGAVELVVSVSSCRMPGQQDGQPCICAD